MNKRKSWFGSKKKLKDAPNEKMARTRMISDQDSFWVDLGEFVSSIAATTYMRFGILRRQQKQGGTVRFEDRWIRGMSARRRRHLGEMKRARGARAPEAVAQSRTVGAWTGAGSRGVTEVARGERVFQRAELYDSFLIPSAQAGLAELAPPWEIAWGFWGAEEMRPPGGQRQGEGPGQGASRLRTATARRRRAGAVQDTSARFWGFEKREDGWKSASLVPSGIAPGKMKARRGVALSALKCLVVGAFSQGFAAGLMSFAPLVQGRELCESPQVQVRTG